MGLEIIGDVGDQGSGQPNGNEPTEETPTTKFIIWDLAGREVLFLEVPEMLFEGMHESEMALHIEWNLTRTRNQINGHYLSQHQVMIPDMVLLDKRIGFLLQWLIPNNLERLQFELAWEQEMGEFIDGLRENLTRMILTQGMQGADHMLNRQQRRQMEREQLRRMHRGN